MFPDASTITTALGFLLSSGVGVRLSFAGPNDLPSIVTVPLAGNVGIAPLSAPSPQPAIPKAAEAITTTTRQREPRIGSARMAVSILYVERKGQGFQQGSCRLSSAGGTKVPPAAFHQNHSR